MLYILYYKFTKMSNVFLHFFYFYLLFFTKNIFLVIFHHGFFVVKLPKSKKSRGRKPRDLILFIEYFSERQ